MTTADTAREPLLAPDYRRARQQFLTAARSLGCRLEAEIHPLPGITGEELALDAAWQPAGDGAALLIVSSACHGIEGHVGSAVQCALLRDDALQASIRAAGIAVLYLHALNPHGFSYGRRVTEDNVDLNRNFVDFTRPRPRNTAYQALARILLPPRWPPGALNHVQLLGFIARYGLSGAQAGITAGQYDAVDGLFYGGCEPTWSRRALLAVLARRASGYARVVWLDLHSGLGPRAAATCILTGHPEVGALAQARAWWGKALVSSHDRRSPSALVHGEMLPAWAAANPGVEFTGVVIEFGTQSKRRVLDALRGDHWLHLHPDASPADRVRIEQAMRAAFAPADAGWQRRAVANGRAVVARAVAGLRVVAQKPGSP